MILGITGPRPSKLIGWLYVDILCITSLNIMLLRLLQAWPWVLILQQH